jgi:hypothetical protein
MCPDDPKTIAKWCQRLQDRPWLLRCRIVGSVCMDLLEVPAGGVAVAASRPIDRFRRYQLGPGHFWPREGGTLRRRHRWWVTFSDVQVEITNRT